MTQYPGLDPDDPFSRPPNEQGHNPPAPPPDQTPDQAPDQTPAQTPAQPGTEETAPIQREEIGYWERKAYEDRQRLTEQADPQADQQAGDQGQGPSQSPPPPPPTPGPELSQQPIADNPWTGYGQPAPTTPYQQGSAPHAYPGPAYGEPGLPGYGYAVQPPKHPQSTTALVLGLVGLVGGCLCGLPLLVAPFAWVVGAKTKREIAASNGQLGGEGNAQAGFVMGIIGTVLLVLAMLAVAGLVVALVATDASTGTSTQF